MDLRAYYAKIRATEQTLSGRDVVVVSLATADGGREGVLHEAPRSLAAKLIVEGRARLASPEEAEAFKHDENAAYQRAQEISATSHSPLTVIPEAELRSLRLALSKLPQNS